jgi:hypothetical protein
MKRLTDDKEGVVGVTDAKDYRKNFGAKKGAVYMRVSLAYAKKNYYACCECCDEVIKMARKKRKSKVLVVIHPRQFKGYMHEMHVVALVDKSYQTP